MKPERKKELEEQAANRSEEDKMLMHILYAHVVGAFAELAIAQAEAITVDDERAERLANVLGEIREQIDEYCNDIIETIPGVMGKEEAVAEMEQAQLKDWIENASRPLDDDEQLH